MSKEGGRTGEGIGKAPEKPEGIEAMEHTHAKVYAIYTGKVEPVDGEEEDKYEDTGEYRTLHVMAGSVEDIMLGIQLEEGEYVLGAVLIANMNHNFMSSDRWFNPKK